MADTPDRCFCNKLPPTLQEIKGLHHNKGCDRYVLVLGGRQHIVRLDDNGESIIESEDKETDHEDQ